MKIGRLAFFAYLSFAFDSALKFSVGIQLHLGILSILFVNLFFFLLKPNKLLSPLKKDFSFSIFILYSIVTGMVMNTPGVAIISTYLFITINVFLFTFYTAQYLDKKVFYYFQIILIITGLIQYLAFKIFGIQISFIDPEHYQKGSSVSHRLRGFFVEPNWFAIAISFNSILLIGKDFMGFVSRHSILFGFTILMIILNGTLATIGLLAIIYTLPVIKKRPLKGLLLGFLMLSVLVGTIMFRGAINQKEGGQSILNHASRALPLLRVAEHQWQANSLVLLFGNGLGSWGTEAVANRLSVLVFEKKPSARDGSELPVFIFELGLVGVCLLLFDLMIGYFRCNRDDFHLRGGYLLFFACLVLYPTLKFWMYMPYYFYLRRFSFETHRIKLYS